MLVEVYIGSELARSATVTLDDTGNGVARFEPLPQFPVGEVRNEYKLVSCPREYTIVTDQAPYKFNRP